MPKNARKSTDPYEASRGEETAPPMTSDRKKFLDQMAKDQAASVEESRKSAKKIQDSNKKFEDSQLFPAKSGYKSGGSVRGRGCETKGFGKGTFR